MIARAAFIIIAAFTLAAPGSARATRSVSLDFRSAQIPGRFGISVPLRSTQIPKQRQLEIDPAFVKSQIKDILSAPEYNRSFERREGILEYIRNYIGDAIDRLVQWLLSGLGSSGVGTVMSRVLALVVIALFIGAFMIVALRLSARLRARAGPMESDLGAYELPSSARLMTEARQMADAGDYRGAFVSAYLGSIAYLDEVDALRFSRSRTNWEYVRELRDKGLESIAEEISPLTIDFDRKFYGREDCAKSDYDNALAVHGRVKQRLAA